MSAPAAVRPAAGLAGVVAGAALAGVALAVTALRLADAAPRALPVLAVGCVAGVVLIHRPAWALPGFAALTWSAIDASLLGGVPSPVRAGVIVLAGVGAARALRTPGIAGRPLAIAALLAVPLVLSAVANPGSGGTGPGAPLQELLFLLAGAWCARGPDDVERVLGALAVTAGVLGAGAVASVVLGPSALFPVVDEGASLVRAAGPFGEPNFFALSLAATVPAALALVGRSRAATLVGVLALAGTAGGILATGSRGALVAGAVGVLLALHGGTRQARRAALALLVVLAALLPVFAAQIGGAEARTVEGRATENRIALAMAADHPVLGIGPGAYPVLYRDYSRRMGDDDRSLRAAHSLPLEILAEQGVVGVGCWLGAALLLGALLRGAGRRVRPARTAAACLGAYATGSLFLHGSQLRLPFLLAGLLCAAVLGARRAAAPTPGAP